MAFGVAPLELALEPVELPLDLGPAHATVVVRAFDFGIISIAVRLGVAGAVARVCRSGGGGAARGRFGRRLGVLEQSVTADTALARRGGRRAAHRARWKRIT